MNADEQTIIDRATPADNFTIIPNALIRDARLSRFTRSCLIEILAGDPAWRTTAEAMWRRAQGKRRGEGREAYHRAFKEMAAFGYLTRYRNQHPDGTWYTVLHFRAEPTEPTEPANRVPENRVV